MGYCSVSQLFCTNCNTRRCFSLGIPTSGYSAGVPGVVLPWGTPPRSSQVPLRPPWKPLTPRNPQEPPATPRNPQEPPGPPWVTGYGLRVTVYGLRVTVYGLRFTGYGLWVMGSPVRAEALGRPATRVDQGRSKLAGL